MGWGFVFLFLLFLHFHSCSLSSLSLSFISSTIFFSLSLGDDTKWRVVKPQLKKALPLWRSGLGLPMDKFCQLLTELSAHHTSVFLYPDDSMSEYQSIFTKLGMCIDIVEIMFGIANGKIFSIFRQLFACHRIVTGNYYCFTFFIWLKFCFLCSCFFFGMANSVDPHQTVPSGAVCTFCICCFVKNICIWNFRTFTVICRSSLMWVCTFSMSFCQKLCCTKF